MCPLNNFLDMLLIILEYNLVLPSLFTNPWTKDQFPQSIKVLFLLLAISQIPLTKFFLTALLQFPQWTVVFVNRSFPFPAYIRIFFLSTVVSTIPQSWWFQRGCVPSPAIESHAYVKKIFGHNFVVVWIIGPTFICVLRIKVCGGGGASSWQNCPYYHCLIVRIILSSSNVVQGVHRVSLQFENVYKGS